MDISINNEHLDSSVAIDDTELVGPKLDTLPAEILWAILSKLTFLACIRCSAVSKRLRSAVLSWTHLGSVLSNECRPYELSRILPTYKKYINGSSICALDLTTNYVTRRSHSRTTEELTRLMHLLEMWHCNSIRKAKIKMYCFSEDTWFKTFLSIASTSLTHLSLLTVTIPSKMQHVLKLILGHFTNLTYLSYRSNIFSVYNSLYANKPLDLMPTIPMPLEYIASWDIAQQPHSIQFVPYKPLPLTVLNIEADTMDALGILPIVFSRLTHLTHLRLSGDIFSGRPEDFYRTLFEHCSRLAHFTYVDCAKEYTNSRWFTLLHRQQQGQYNEPTITNYFKLDGIPTTSKGVRRLHIVGNLSGQRAKDHTRAILQLYHEAIVAMHLSSPDAMIQSAIAYLSFPRLRRLRGEDSSWTMPFMDAFFWSCWLRVLQQLRKVQLSKSVVTQDTFISLSLLRHLRSLVLEDCHLVSVRNHDISTIFKESNRCVPQITMIRCQEHS